ncbi:MAG: RNA polymerase sigma factor [Phycisphaerales bacterium]|nr:RNA polymerase sigma factor [Phycisphaerales bacterium]
MTIARTQHSCSLLEAAHAEHHGGTDAIRTDDERVGADLSATFDDDFRTVATYLQRRTGDPELARELASEVFAHAIIARHRWRDRGLPVRCWLLGIATRRLMQHQRRERRRSLLHMRFWSLADRAGTAVQAHEARPGLSDSAESVRRSLQRVPDRFADVLVLHHVEGLTIEQIAAALAVPPGTVKSRLSRGRAMLAREMEAESHHSGATP